MEKDRYKGGVIFKWINKDEIYAKYNGKGKKQYIQANIDKNHIRYIATRSGVDTGTSKHGLFGNILNTNEVELLELERIEEYVKEISNKNIDIFKTVISLKDEDTILHNLTNKKAWKNLLEERISDIARELRIPINSLEWTASLHMKKENIHCHFVYWDKEQNLEVRRKPFIKFKEIKGILAKGVYKEELNALYDIKNVSKSKVSKLSHEGMSAYKERLKQIYNNEDLILKVVDTTHVESILNETINNMEIGDIIYISNKLEPHNFVEIEKTEEGITYKNIGPKAILYKEKTYLETTLFLSNFKDLIIFKNKKELEDHMKFINIQMENIENELKEIMPTIFETPIIPVNIEESSIERITNNLVKIEKTSNGFKKGFKYQYQESKTKEVIDETTMLIINSSMYYKAEFNKYIETCVNIDKILQKIENNKQYQKSRNNAKLFLLNKVGNQILKSLKEYKTEEYKKKQEEWKIKREFWDRKKLNNDLNELNYKKELESINTKLLIKEVYKLLSQENLSKGSKLKRITKTFGDLSKREIKELIRKNKNTGLDWYNER
ncbi:MAG: relaxase MobL [Clostridia bacterium]|nr:relaxase MobL [Clostridia bacterium]